MGYGRESPKAIDNCLPPAIAQPPGTAKEPQAPRRPASEPPYLREVLAARAVEADHVKVWQTVGKLDTVRFVESLI